MLVRKLPYVSIVVLFFASTLILPAQEQAEDGCPLFVQTALETVGEACVDLGRNQICYGHGTVTALDIQQDPLLGFALPGDISDILQVFSVATAPMDLTRNIWGVAVLVLQANLPDTMPGQNVTFLVYGDTALTRDIDLDAPEPVTLTAQATNAMNVRSGPGTGYDVLGGLASDEEVIVTGRNGAGDWVQIVYADATAWVYVPLMTIDDDLDALAVVETGSGLDRTSGPMQAFRLTTGIGEPACKEAPQDGLLVQTPAETTVYFRVNGVEVQVGSTALMQLDDTTLAVNTFDGAVSVTSGGQTETAEPGQRVDVVAGQVPAPPVPYDIADVTGAPVQLLPEEVHIPPPDGTQLSVVGCDFSEGTTVAAIDQPLSMSIEWCGDTPDELSNFEEQSTFTMTFDGQEMEIWSGIPFQQSATSFCKRWWWVVQEPDPGAHSAMVIAQDTTGHYSEFTCTITVQ